MIGVAELAGSLVPLVAARVLLGLSRDSAALKHTAGRIVVMRLGNGLVGVLVDGMNEIVRVSPEDLDPVPPVLTRARGEARSRPYAG